MFDYPIIAPPFSLKFEEMTKKEIDNYFQWYIEQIPNRIPILERTVRNTPGFEDWRADYLPESLDKLEEWFVRQVETRERTKEEIEEIYAGVPERIKVIPLPNWELTNKTFSIAMDIGMYLSQIMLKHIPRFEWQCDTKKKKWIEHGQPVLAGLEWHVFNPTRSMISDAYSIAKGNWQSSELRGTFEYWNKLSQNIQ